MLLKLESRWSILRIAREATLSIGTVPAEANLRDGMVGGLWWGQID